MHLVSYFQYFSRRTNLKKTKKFFLLLIISLGFTACNSGSGGGSKNKVGPVGEQISSKSSALAQAIAGIEFCSLASVKYDDEPEYYKEHQVFGENGTLEYFREGVDTGSVVDEMTGKWGASNTHVSYKMNGEFGKIKAKYLDGQLTYTHKIEGQEFEEVFIACGGRSVSNSTDSETAKAFL